MKKSLIVSAISLLMAVTPAVSVFAEEPETDGYSHDVTVGEVDEPIYSVDILWGDMTFDWKYNDTIKGFNFESRHNCSAVGIMPDGKDWVEYQRDNGWLFSDNNCQGSPYSGEISEGTTYYYRPPASKSGIDITDNSINGSIQAIALFTPENVYNWVSGTFGYMDDGWDGFIEGHPVTHTPEFITYDDGILPFTNIISATGYKAHAHAELKLAKNDSYISGTLINPDDKIGTITIEITPDM